MKTRMIRLIALVCASSSACTEPSFDDPVVRLDSAGIEVVRSAAPVSTEPVLQLGEVETDLAEVGHEFYQVQDMARVDSLLLVAEPTRVRAFHPDGSEAWAFGREGDGPREFRRVSDLEVRGDSIVVFDYWRRRVSILTRDGWWVRGITLGTPLLKPDLVPTASGYVVSATSSAIMDPDGPTGLIRTPSLVIHADWSGEREDTIARLAGTESVRIAGPNGITDQRPIFGHMSFLVADASGRIARIDGNFLGYESLDGEGDVVARRSGAMGVDLPDSLLEAEWMAREEILGPAATMDLQESTPEPLSRPMAVDAKSDASGRVWVREHYGEFRNRMGPGDQVWQVFAEDGVWVGRVEVPLAFSVLEIYDDVVLGVHRNDMGVERPQARRVNAVWAGG